MKIGLDLVFKKRTVQKFDIHSDEKTGCNPQFKLKVTKSNFTCIQYAVDECSKTPPKHSIADFLN